MTNLNEKKNKIMFALRITPETKRYITMASEYHNMTMTDYVVKQCLRKNFLEVNFKELDKIGRLFANVSNNINQIAYSINVAKKTGAILTNEQMERIEKSFDEVKELLDLHNKANNDAYEELYKIIINSKERELDYLWKDGYDDFDENDEHKYDW